MFAFLQYLIAILLSLPGPGTRPPTDGNLLVGAVLLSGSSFALLLFGGWALRRIQLRGAAGTRGVAASVTPVTIAILAVFYGIAQFGGGAFLPTRLGIDDWLVVPHLVRLAPYLLLQLTLHFVVYSIGRALGTIEPGFVRSIVFGVRQALVPLAPTLFLLLVYDLLAGLARGDPDSVLARATQVLERVPLLQVGFALVAVFVSLLLIPFVLRLVWRAKPLPPGPLRDRLTAYSKRVGLRVNDILVWPTDRSVLNAALIGGLPGFRYVMLTDGLIETLGEDEVLAVFAHEAGHARRGHVLLYFAFSVVLALLTLLPGQWLGPIGAVLGALPPLLRTVLLIVVWFGVVFGWVSRRFEQEADVFGIETMSERGRELPAEGEHPFVRALETIATEAGDVREVTGWRHFSIADRVDFVRAYLTDRGVRRAHRRMLLLVRSALIATVLLVTGLAAIQAPTAWGRAGAVWDSLTEPERRMLEQLGRARIVGPPEQRALLFAEAAELARVAGRTEEALRWQREAVALSPDQAVLLVSYARLLEQNDRPRGALLAWRDAVALPGLPDALVDHAEARIEALETRIRGPGNTDE